MTRPCREGNVGRGGGGECCHRDTAERLCETAAQRHAFTLVSGAPPEPGWQTFLPWASPRDDPSHLAFHLLSGSVKSKFSSPRPPLAY